MSSETKEFVRGWFSWRRLKKKKMFDGRDKGGGGGGNIETLGNKGWGGGHASGDSSGGCVLARWCCRTLLTRIFPIKLSFRLH